MVRRNDRENILTNSPFFDLKEINLRSKLVPISETEEDNYYISKRIVYKSEEFVKAIVERNTNITEYYKLSNLSKTILYYIINSQLEYNSLVFQLSVSVVARILQYKSTKKIYIAINELIEFKYIARTSTKELYWINHNKYYKGNYLVIKLIENR